MVFVYLVFWLGTKGLSSAKPAIDPKIQEFDHNASLVVSSSNEHLHFNQMRRRVVSQPLNLQWPRPKLLLDGAGASLSYSLDKGGGQRTQEGALYFMLQTRSFVAFTGPPRLKSCWTVVSAGVWPQPNR